MFSRLSQLNRETIPLHHEEALWLLRFTANLINLGLHGLPFRADHDKLEEWADIRKKLTACKEPIMHYGSNFVHKDAELDEHRQLVWAVDAVMVELKLRNLNLGQREIQFSEIDAIRKMLPELDRCRKRVVFY